MRVWRSVVAVVVMVMVMVVVETEAGRQERQASRCGPGESCTPINSCRAFQELLKNPNRDLLNRIRRAVCTRNRREFKVCCPGSIDTTPKPDTTPTQSPGNGEAVLPSKCRSSESRGDTIQSFVIDGIDAELGDLPWMALLGYNSVSSPTWGCGGTLISQQYVLTAAHCVHETYTAGSQVSVVRLGELNLETTRDCETKNGQRVCAPTPQDFRPSEVILHPNFDTRVPVSDDIALIRLDRKATLHSKYVNTLCLPPAGASVEAVLRGRLGEVAGWGLTGAGQTSQILQKANLPYVNKATCNPHFDNNLVPEQICFGGKTQDSCQGDSGGPVVVGSSSRNPLLVGIVSQGKAGSRCGTVGVPAVYTHVAAYRSWITSLLRP